MQRTEPTPRCCLLCAALAQAIRILWPFINNEIYISLRDAGSKDRFVCTRSQHRTVHRKHGQASWTEICPVAGKHVKSCITVVAYTHVTSRSKYVVSSKHLCLNKRLRTKYKVQKLIKKKSKTKKSISFSRPKSFLS